ncbi:MAG: hypothetical protein K6G25_12280 [Bacteroidales bacterium]|nr:hypothetical protein [Bacteroidales bacterium]
MKKLALALMCLVSVAFFASCTKPVENPEPSIALMTGENFVYDGQTIDLYADYNIGFRAASNSQTMKELASFSLVGKIYDVDDTEIYTEDTTFTISGTEYVYQEALSFGTETKDLVGKVTFVATVTDVDGKSNNLTINLNINQPAQPLEVNTINWVRRGSTSQNADEMAACGLKWVARDAYHANIQPLNDDCQLYTVLNSLDKYNEITTDLEKAAYFAELMETARPVDEYRNISTSASGTYNDILAVIDADGEQHLILFERAEVTTGSFGTQTSIFGKVK